ncbi:hypothetical protein EDB85DRAFT_2148767 [Lactarius pseudohatsudake]|nr:hypothetical protein EDB85DRAFT_2148767 [Lactarius pseudohatsudake]
MRTDILDNWPPLEEAISEDVPTPLLSTHRSTISRPASPASIPLLRTYAPSLPGSPTGLSTAICCTSRSPPSHLAPWRHSHDPTPSFTLRATAAAFDVSENGGNATRDADSDDHGYLYTTTAGLLLSPRPPAPVQIQLPSTGASSSELPTGCTGSCEAPSPEPSRSDAATAIRCLRECFGPIFDTATTAIMTNMAMTSLIQIPSPSKSRRRQVLKRSKLQGLVVAIPFPVNTNPAA